MKTIRLPHTEVKIPVLALGTMRMASLSEQQTEALITSAMELGINFFDHADIYGNGQAESVFGNFLTHHPELRKEMIIQSKCDIVTAAKGGPRYDTGKAYIISQVEQSIEKLHCSYLDILLLHRPDPLLDPVEVAQAFKELKERNLVRYFGVSNFPASKISMLQKYVEEPLLIDQIQLSPVHALLIDEGIYFNMNDVHAPSRSDQILDYAMEHNLLLQAWCPLQASWEDGTYLDNPKYPKLNEVLEKLASQYQVTKAAIAVAWILKLPAAVQVIAGTTNPEHLKEMAKGCSISLSRQEWYAIYMAQHHPLP